MILKNIEKTIDKFDLFEGNRKIVVAISGGPDSVALVYLLNKLVKKYRLNLHLAHLNHMLRKDEAQADCEFVQKLAERLDLPLTHEKVNVKQFAREEKLSIEEAAREVRYAFLLKVAEDSSASAIALGHNRDDQAETVLMRLLRGSGVSGLRGIPAKRKLKHCFIIRPLIELTRSEIEEFLKLKAIRFRTDSSNLTDLYLRNRIRNKLLPLLEKEFNPQIKQVLANLAENISDDFSCLEKIGQEAFNALRRNTTNKKVAIKLKGFFSLDRAVQKLVARSAIKELKGNLRRIDYRHWQELQDLIEKRPNNAIVDLPGKVSAVKKNGEIVFYSRNSN